MLYCGGAWTARTTSTWSRASSASQTSGGLTYFGHVGRILSERLAALGFDPHIHIVRTPPTASLPTRAARVAEVIDATARRGGAPLHLIGHSSGGLDVRLLTAPGVGLPTALDVERLAARVRTVVTVATPHHGTPLASFFTTLRGQQLLQLLSLNTIYVLNFGHLPLAALLWMGSLLVRFGEPGREQRRPRRTLRTTPRGLHAGTAPGGAGAVARRGPRPGADAPADARGDGGLQCLGPAASRRSLRRGRRPGGAPEPCRRRSPWGSIRRRRSRTPSTALSTSSSRRRRGASRRGSHRTRHAHCDAPTAAMPSPGENDGIVPTLSQACGRVVHAAVADHLDVLGHFRDAAHDPPHVDWLVSGSGFDRRRFEALWADVAHFLVGDALSQPKRRRAAGRPRAGRRGRTKRQRR